MLCQLCLSNSFKYTCPKCSINYCSVDCYKSAAHYCSELFFKEQLAQYYLEKDDKIEQILINNSKPSGLDEIHVQHEDIAGPKVLPDDLNDLLKMLSVKERECFEKVLNEDPLKLMRRWVPFWKTDVPSVLIGAPLNISLKPNVELGIIDYCWAFICTQRTFLGERDPAELDFFTRHSVITQNPRHIYESERSALELLTNRSFSLGSEAIVFLLKDLRTVFYKKLTRNCLIQIVKNAGFCTSIRKKAELFMSLEVDFEPKIADELMNEYANINLMARKIARLPQITEIESK